MATPHEINDAIALIEQTINRYAHSIAPDYRAALEILIAIARPLCPAYVAKVAP